MDNFSYAGDASTPLFPAFSNDNPGSVFSDGALHNLITSPFDFSIGTWPLSDFLVYYKPTLQLPLAQNSDSQLLFSDFVSENFKITKEEQASSSFFNTEDSTLAGDFFSRNLLSLQSIESPTGFDSLLANLSTNQPTLEPVAEDFNILQTKNTQKRSEKKRSQRISDKFRKLQKLMPRERRMDTASMLGEAHKYIKFLQAQVKVLQLMPIESSFKSESGALGSVFGEMGMLSRQQLLQVLLSTPEAQTRLYSQGCCVYSSEQLVAFKNVAERRAALQQLMFHSTINS